MAATNYKIPTSVTIGEFEIKGDQIQSMVEEPVVISLYAKEPYWDGERFTRYQNQLQPYAKVRLLNGIVVTGPVTRIEW